MNILPNFFICSSPKTGSYSLWFYLSKHPEILMSKVKEPAYFFENSKITLDKYLTYFDHYKNQKAIGEASLYLGDKGVPHRIKIVVPKAKLIFCFRNPLERALSHYQYRLGRGDEKRSLNELIQSEHIEFPIYYSMYFSHVREFLKIFSKEQCKFIITEKMQRNFQETLREICEFLEVDDKFNFPYEGEKNITLPATKKLPKLVKDWNRGSGYIGGNFNRPAIGVEEKIFFFKRLKYSFLLHWLKYQARIERRTLLKSIETTAWIKMMNIFEAEKNRLEEMIGFKINEWNFKRL